VWLRVPGFGVRNVKRIVKVLRYRALTVADLAKLRVSLKKSQFFIVTADHNPAARQIDAPKLPERFIQSNQQMMLFDAAQTARTGEL